MKFLTAALLTVLSIGCPTDNDPVLYTGVVFNKIFHRPFCPLAGVHEDMKELQFFTDREAAIICGYKPCKSCKP